MATLSNPIYFKGGADAGESRLVGIVGGLNRVVRYTLTLDAYECATHLSIDMDSSNYTQWGDYSSEGWKDVNGKTSLYFYIGTDPDEFVNAGYDQVSSATGKVTMVYRGGYGVEENLSWNMTLAGDVLLAPGVTYYLWVYPGYKAYGYFTWYDTGTGRFKYDIELSGNPGLVYINGEAYMPCIFNGSGWDLCLPYIGNGSTYDLCSG